MAGFGRFCLEIGAAQNAEKPVAVGETPQKSLKCWLPGLGSNQRLPD